MSLSTRRSLVVLATLAAGLLIVVPQKLDSVPYGQITEMRLGAVPRDWHGACPVTINFNGSITVDGPNSVTYGITRSDGGHGQGQMLHFDGAGTKAVHFTWRLGGPGMNFNGWAQIGSGNMRSNQAAFQIHCR